MQSSIHTFTSMCWDKCVLHGRVYIMLLRRTHRCVTSTPSTRFSGYESSCLSNCVERFLDTSLYMVRQIEQQRTQAGLH
jgi:import inner membrane translocase subunit TIM8